jgi:SAM-dependent methyltransferase
MTHISSELVESEGIFVSRRLLKDEPRPDEDLGRLLDVARRKNWRQALKEVYSDEAFVDYVVNESRLSLIPVLPLDPSLSILEIGPGFGQMTVELSKRVATLDAIEADLRQARFCKIRAKQEGCRNVRIVAAGESGILPFGDCTFDGVVMNLVLEWCGIRETDQTHEDVQKNIFQKSRGCSCRAVSSLFRPKTDITYDCLQEDGMNTCRTYRSEVVFPAGSGIS